MTGPYRAILYKEVYYMNTFTLKGTFLDTPAPDTLRVREGYLLCENGLCAGFSETAPAGVEVLDYTGKIITPGLWTCICTRRSTAIAARRWIWSCWTGCSSTPTPRKPTTPIRPTPGWATPILCAT